MDWATTLAKELKQRENPQMLGAILGIVITPPPALKISILNGSVFITNCYILQNIVEGYTKIATIPEQTATGTAKGKGTTNIVNDGGEGAIPHSHTVITDVAIKTIGIPSAEICFEDTLKAGDEVSLVVSPDNTTYFVIGKPTKIPHE